MSINRGTVKEVVVYTYNEVLLSHDKNEIMPFAAIWMDLAFIILTEVSQRQIPYDITYRQNPIKNDTKELMDREETHRFQKQSLGYHGGNRGGGRGELGEEK